MKTKIKILSILGLMLTSTIATMGCGSRVSGTYTFNQMGGPYYLSTNQQCQTITLNVQENGNSVTGSGKNACGTETLIGTSSNGIITVSSLSFMQDGATQGYTPGQVLTYSGTLTVNGNTITGTLMPSGYYGGGNQLIINGTKN